MKWLLAAIPLLILAGVVWLGFLNHDVEWRSKAFGTILIRPPLAPPPPACKDALAAVAQSNANIAETEQRLREQQDYAVQFDRENQTSGQIRFWGVVGYQYSAQNWTRVHEREQEIRDLTGKLKLDLESLRKACTI